MPLQPTEGPPHSKHRPPGAFPGVSAGTPLNSEVNIHRPCQRGDMLLFKEKHLSHVWSPLGSVFSSPPAVWWGQRGGVLCLCPPSSPGAAPAFLLLSGTTQVSAIMSSLGPALGARAGGRKRTGSPAVPVAMQRLPGLQNLCCARREGCAPRRAGLATACHSFAAKD